MAAPQQTYINILKSCNYEIHTLKKQGNYKNTNFLKDNEDQNIHVLAIFAIEKISLSHILIYEDKK